MTEEAPWMGTTPAPPTDLATESVAVCNGLLTCSADLHTVACARVAREVRLSDAKAWCSNHGHDWTFVQTAAGDLHKVVCERCPKAYRCEPISP